MAEALLERIDGTNFQAFSAGTSPAHLHPFALEVMNEMGLRLTPKTSRPLTEWRKEGIDIAITLGDTTSSPSPDFPAVENIHWKFDNPLESADPEKQLRVFRAVRDQIAQRLRLFAIVEVRAQSPRDVSVTSAERQIAAGA